MDAAGTHGTDALLRTVRACSPAGRPAARRDDDRTRRSSSYHAGNPTGRTTSVIRAKRRALTRLSKQPGQRHLVGASGHPGPVPCCDEQCSTSSGCLCLTVVAGTGKRLFAEAGSRVPLLSRRPAPRQTRQTLRYAPPRRRHGSCRIHARLRRFFEDAPAGGGSMTSWILTVRTWMPTTPWDGEVGAGSVSESDAARDARLVG